ncbi:MAG: 7-carboxy-7-deazaguanine synthase QueE [Bacteroides sp.]|nr:7-carboxy-7-deazaguanine synthase QueE [Bacteroides sp.]MCM1412842.1 7-carboxy-7-deazaguanine synthase QueE [Bacteroides sp.]MCM1471511.1 7-carboxy-7-deazaguanine synthase QueE [Bacteroides sp.]
MKSTEPSHTYRVNEIFHSLQGEGMHTGTPCVFLRFSGCNRRCQFCDTDFDSFTTMTIEQILAEITRYPSRRIVATGGEPLLQLDATLIEAIHSVGYTIAVETNGTLPVPDGIDWVTCSPKDPPLAIDRIDELKIVFTGQDVEAIAASLPPTPNRFLQPLSCSNTQQTIDYILSHPHWRLSLQTHKLTGIR